MFSERAPHQIAVKAMLIALGLPIVLGMFLAIRTRQLHSTANPRWAQFARVTGPQASTQTKTAQTLVNPIPSVRVESVEATDSKAVAPEVAHSVVQRADQASTSELVEIRYRLEQLTQIESERLAEQTQLEYRITTIQNQIGEIRSELPSTETASDPTNPGHDSKPSQPDELSLDDDASDLGRVATDSMPEPDLQRFLNLFVEMTQINLLSTPAPQPIPDKPRAVPMTLQRARLDRSLNEQRYFLRRENNGILICTTDEAVHVKPDQIHRILRANWPHDLYGAQLHELLPFIIKGLVNVSECPNFTESAGRPTELDGTVSISRRALARAFYESAAVSWQQGEQFKARQQIEASLRQNSEDLDAIRLRNEMHRVSAQHPVP